MRLTLFFTCLLLTANSSLYADLTDWQNEVTSQGTTAAATHFSTVSGSSPININVGTLTGSRSFEFIVNAGALGNAQTLLGDTTSGNPQQIFFEQATNSGNYGITTSGSAIDSGVAHTTNADVHLTFVENFPGTDLYVNGTLVTSMSTFLTISGNTGLGATDTGAGFVNNLDGDILGFASYDSELTAAEIAAHSNAFFAASVPEPTSFGLFAAAGLGLCFRRRR